MCIAIFSTAHPEYALILINNRDEFLNRPTKPADWWSAPHTNVLGGRDLLRSEQGTWLGITREGRITVLTNFRESNIPVAPDARSRGAIANAFLTQSPHSKLSTEGFIKALVEEGEGLKGVGGFSLVCGKVGEPLAVASNRTPESEGIKWIAGEKGETRALSNGAFGDRSWGKVTRGEDLAEGAIREHVDAKGSKDRLIESLFHVLEDDTLPREKIEGNWDSQVGELRNSVFIPAVVGDFTDADGKAKDSDEEGPVDKGRKYSAKADGMSGPYATQKQTIILVTHNGNVTFIERNMYDANGRPTKGRRHEKRFEFDVIS